MNNNTQKVLAGIVTYNPSISRLLELLSSLDKQVDEILIVDNASSNSAQIRKAVSSIKSVRIHNNPSNKGIASGLKIVMEYAINELFPYVITLDQDSLLNENTIKHYKKAITSLPNAGMVTCLIKDRNFSDVKTEFQRKRVEKVSCCITSGAMIDVDAYKKTDGYDESFFIDFVDYDICLSLREAGFNIYRINYFGLIHEDGQGENRFLFWKKIVVYNKDPSRIYYQTRNLRKLKRKHKLFTMRSLLREEFSIFIRIILYEYNKPKRLSAFKKGLTETISKSPTLISNKMQP